MRQGDSARDFDTSESMKNVGIPDVFPIFHTARLGKRSAEACSSHCAVLPFRPGHDPQGIGIAVPAEPEINNAAPRILGSRLQSLFSPIDNTGRF